MNMVNFSAQWLGDERVAQFATMSSPCTAIVVSAAYLYIIKVLGPKFMRNRTAFELRIPMILYNFGLVGLNLWIFIDGGRYGWFGSYSWTCAECDKSATKENLGMVNIVWWFYFSKFIELFDTVFFVLRKKNTQITTLHVVHHSLLPVSCWFTVKYVPVGHSTFMGWTNAGVHVLMYSYYGLAAIGPKMQPYLKWKKYLTKVQLVQFMAMFVHSAQVVLYKNCKFPIWCLWFNVGHALLFMGLFADFYRKAYVSRDKNVSGSLKKIRDIREECSKIESLEHSFSDSVVRQRMSQLKGA